jgi:hypothetical protein
MFVHLHFKDTSKLKGKVEKAQAKREKYTRLNFTASSAQICFTGSEMIVQRTARNDYNFTTQVSEAVNRPPEII